MSRIAPYRYGAPVPTGDDRPPRTTILVADAAAVRHHAYRSARATAHGTSVATPLRLAGRLAGPHLRAATVSDVAEALREVPTEVLGDLASLADLPGLTHALAETLHAADAFDLDLVPAAVPPDAWEERAVHTRLADLARVAAWLRTRLAPELTSTSGLVDAAIDRVHRAPAVIGPVHAHGIVDLTPAFRRLVEAVAEHVPVHWTVPPHPSPWTPRGSGVVLDHAAHHDPDVLVESHADPVHEVRAALRWVRDLLSRGVPAGEVAVVALDPAPYESAWTAHAAQAARAGVDVHATDGVPALHRPHGRMAAAWCDAVQNGPTRSRVASLVRTARAVEPNSPLAAVDLTWDDRLDPSDGFHDAGAWDVQPPRIDRDAWQWVRALVASLLASPGGAPVESWLDRDGPSARLITQIRQRALGGDLLAALARVREPDGLEPVMHAVWTRPEGIVATPRQHVRIVGVASGSWPRANREDPLLPSHVLGDRVLELAPRGRQDRWTFDALVASTARSVVVTYPRRSADGKERTPSPLLARWVQATVHAPAHAPTATPFSEGDRRSSRPTERAGTAHVQAAMATWTAWHRSASTAHDGLVRARHPASERALARPLSPSRAWSFLHDPFAFAMQGMHCVQEPDFDPDRVTMDPRTFGTFVHAVLERVLLTATRPSDGPGTGIERRVDEAIDAVLAQDDGWARHRSMLPSLVWEATLADARRLALAAWQHAAQAARSTPGTVRFAEVRFGMPDRRPHVATPWPAEAPVPVPGADLTLHGVIDRVDVAGDGLTAWVTDYKTGASKSASELAGGREVQRAAYALVVHHHLRRGEVAPTVHAALYYPRDRTERPLVDVQGEVDRLSRALAAAEQRAREGGWLPGDDAWVGRYRDHALALPADLKGYAARKREAFAAARDPIERIWSNDAGGERS